MSKTFIGGCACGAVRYRTTASPVFENHCQCRDCQRRSGTGHGSYMTFADRRDVTITGEARIWEVEADSGNRKAHAFCPVCGTPVYLTFSAMPALIAIAAGSLDDPGQFEPKVITYGMRAHAWDAMDPSLAVFDRMPG